MRVYFSSILLFFAASSAFAHVVIKTNHYDVNLWSEPGREDGETIDKVERFEEVQLLETKRIANGEIWYKVQLRRLPDGRLHTKTGWVDSKFFTKISRPVKDDEPTEADSSDCAKCRLMAKSGRSKTSGIKAIADSIGQDTGRGSKKFIWPVRGRISSGFGMRRHPITGRVKFHNGVDIAGNGGKKVEAAKGGTVTSSISGCRTGQLRCNGGYGNSVVINHPDGSRTEYRHLSPSCRLPPSGSHVAQGQAIGCVGSTGFSTGPHLHFSVIINGRYINPLTVLSEGT